MNNVVDVRLVVGSALFGMGWGLAGMCPGPALLLLPFNMITVSLIFIPALVIG